MADSANTAKPPPGGKPDKEQSIASEASQNSEKNQEAVPAQAQALTASVLKEQTAARKRTKKENKDFLRSVSENAGPSGGAQGATPSSANAAPAGSSASHADTATKPPSSDTKQSGGSSKKSKGKKAAENAPEPEAAEKAPEAEGAATAPDTEVDFEADEPTEPEMENANQRAEQALSDPRWSLPEKMASMMKAPSDIDSKGSQYFVPPGGDWSQTPDEVIEVWAKQYPTLFEAQLRDPCVWPTVAFDGMILTGGQLIASLRSANDDLKKKMAELKEPCEQATAALSDALQKHVEASSRLYDEAFGQLEKNMKVDFEHNRDNLKRLHSNQEVLCNLLGEMRDLTNSMVTEVSRRMKAVPETQKQLIAQWKINTRDDLTKHVRTMFNEGGMEKYAKDIFADVFKKQIDIDFTQHARTDSRIKVLEEQQTRIESLELDSAKAHIEENGGFLIEHGKLIRQLGPATDELSKTVEQLTEENKKLRQECTNNRAQIGKLEQSNASLQQTVDALQADHEQLWAAVSECRHQNAQLHDDVSECQDAYEQMSSVVAAARLPRPDHLGQ